jgi:hypothetical protein
VPFASLEGVKGKEFPRNSPRFLRRCSEGENGACHLHIGIAAWLAGLSNDSLCKLVALFFDRIGDSLQPGRPLKWRLRPCGFEGLLRRANCLFQEILIRRGNPGDFVTSVRVDDRESFGCFDPTITNQERAWHLN